MVSLRCKMIVKSELKKLGLRYVAVELGMVDILEDITQQQRIQLAENLQKSELELLDDKNSVLVKKIVSVITEMIHYSDEITTIAFDEYLCKKIKLDYGYMATVFSEVNGITIEQFIIINKTEKAKEILLYEDTDITQIAKKLNYTSVTAFSAEFKRTTGLTPKFFRELKQKRNKILKKVGTM